MHEDHMMSSCMVFTRDMSKLPYTIKTRQSSLFYDVLDVKDFIIHVSMDESAPTI